MEGIGEDAAKVEIINFSEGLAGDFRRLGIEWLQKYFKVEKKDELILSNPQKYIIDKEGYIFFAGWKEEIVGTIAMIKMADGN